LPGIRLATSASKPSISSEQNTSTKSSTISQPPSASTARIWTHSALLKAYEQSYGEVISRSTLARILRRAGFRWRKARRVLTSPHPRYHEKLELLLNTLHHLGENEMFCFLDEWGPTQVRKRGGKAYRNEHVTIPRHQISRGNVSLVGGLSATKSGNMALSRIKGFTCHDGHDRSLVQPVPHKSEALYHIGRRRMAQFRSAP
jgi:hypothetical protein